MNPKYILEHALRYGRVGSTNDIAKACARDGAPEGTLVLADAQESGRGRMGRSFLSPTGGLYLSLLLRPTLAGVDALAVTTAAAVAVAEAVERLTGVPAQIKWVNDVYQNQKKVCGILTEGEFDADGKLRFAVLGIGVNLREPQGGFPEGLNAVAGGLFPADAVVDRDGFTLDLLTAFLCYYEHLADKPHLGEYRRREMLTGAKVNVLGGGAAREATVLSVGEDFSLQVRYADGSTESLSSGEVSVKKTG